MTVLYAAGSHVKVTLLGTGCCAIDNCLPIATAEIWSAGGSAPEQLQFAAGIFLVYNQDPSQFSGLERTRWVQSTNYIQLQAA